MWWLLSAVLAVAAMVDHSYTLAGVLAAAAVFGALVSKRG
jgi:hypothetical protein